MNNVKKIRAKWANKELCVGTNVNFTDASVSEFFGKAGYDIVWIDLEHSAMSVDDALNHVRAAHGSGAAALSGCRPTTPCSLSRSSSSIPQGSSFPA